MRSDLKLTYKDYLTLPEGGPRFELIEGELFKMSPSPTWRHQLMVTRLVETFSSFVRKQRLGFVFTAPLDIVLSDENVLQPDVLYVSHARKALLQPKGGGVMGAPDLCVEVVSPGNLERHLDVKRVLYARHGVTELWHVHPERQTVEVFRLQERAEQPARIFQGKETLTTALLPGLEIPLPDLFAS